MADGKFTLGFDYDEKSLMNIAKAFEAIQNSGKITVNTSDAEAKLDALEKHYIAVLKNGEDELRKMSGQLDKIPVIQELNEIRRAMEVLNKIGRATDFNKFNFRLDGIGIYNIDDLNDSIARLQNTLVQDSGMDKAIQRFEELAKIKLDGKNIVETYNTLRELQALAETLTTINPELNLGKIELKIGKDVYKGIEGVNNALDSTLEKVTEISQIGYSSLNRTMNDVEKSIKSDMQKEYKKELVKALKTGSKKDIMRAALNYEVSGQAGSKVVTNENLEFKNTLGIIENLKSASKMNEEQFQAAMKEVLSDTNQLEKTIDSITRLFRAQMLNGSANGKEISEYAVIENNQLKYRDAVADFKNHIIDENEYNKILKQIRTSLADSMRNGASRIVNTFFSEEMFEEMSKAFSGTMEELMFKKNKKGENISYIHTQIEQSKKWEDLKQLSEITKDNISDEAESMMLQMEDVDSLFGSISQLKDILSPKQYDTEIEGLKIKEGLDLDGALKRASDIKNLYKSLIERFPDNEDLQFLGDTIKEFDQNMGSQYSLIYGKTKSNKFIKDNIVPFGYGTGKNGTGATSGDEKGSGTGDGTESAQEGLSEVGKAAESTSQAMEQATEAVESTANAAREVADNLKQTADEIRGADTGEAVSQPASTPNDTPVSERSESKAEKVSKTSVANNAESESIQKKIELILAEKKAMYNAAKSEVTEINKITTAIKALTEAIKLKTSAIVGEEKQMATSASLEVQEVGMIRDAVLGLEQAVKNVGGINLTQNTPSTNFTQNIQATLDGNDTVYYIKNLKAVASDMLTQSLNEAINANEVVIKNIKIDSLREKIQNAIAAGFNTSDATKSTKINPEQLSQMFKDIEMTVNPNSLSTIREQVTEAVSGIEIKLKPLGDKKVKAYGDQLKQIQTAYNELKTVLTETDTAIDSIGDKLKDAFSGEVKTIQTISVYCENIIKALEMFKDVNNSSSNSDNKQGGNQRKTSKNSYSKNVTTNKKRIADAMENLFNHRLGYREETHELDNLLKKYEAIEERDVFKNPTKHSLAEITELQNELLEVENEVNEAIKKEEELIKQDRERESRLEKLKQYDKQIRSTRTSLKSRGESANEDRDVLVQYEQRIEDLTKRSDNFLAGVSDEAQKLDNDILKLGEDIENTTNSINRVSPDKFVSVVTELEDKLVKTKEEMLKNGVNDGEVLDQFEKVADRIQKLKNNDIFKNPKGKTSVEITDIEKEIASIEEDAVNAIVNGKQASKSAKKGNSRINDIKNLIKEAEKANQILIPKGDAALDQRQEIGELISEAQKLKVIAEEFDGSEQEAEDLSEQIGILSEKIHVASDNAKNFKFGDNAQASMLKVDKKFEDLLYKVKQFIAQNSKIKNDSSMFNQFEDLMHQIETLDRTGTNFEMLNDQFYELKNIVTSKGLSGRSLGDEIAYISEKIGLKAIFGGGIYDIINKMKEMVGKVRELDSAMTVLKRVTDETSSSYDKFFKNAQKQAVKLGASVTDLINASGEFAKLGYSLNEAKALGEAAVTYSNVGFMDIGEAISSMSSVIQAFNINAAESMDIVDKMDIIGNSFAIDSAGLGQGLQRSASALVAAGNDLDEAISLITAGNTIIQDPDSVANGIRTISLRIRGAKTELHDLGEETDDMAESSSKLRKQIKAMTGVDIMLDENTFKSTYQILDEIAQVYDKLDDIDRTALVELIAGKNRSNIAASILQSPDVLEKAYSTSLNSAGAAAKELNVYLDSIDGRINTFKASAQGLSETIIDENVIKWIVSLGTSLLNLTNWILEADERFAKFVGNGLKSFDEGIRSINEALSFIESHTTLGTTIDMIGDIGKYFETWGKLPSIIGAVTLALSALDKQSGMKMPSVRAIERMHKPENCWKPLILVDQSAA